MNWSLFGNNKSEVSMAKAATKKKSAEKSEFEAAVQRQKAAVEKLKQTFERIKPFDELSDVLSGKRIP